MAEAVKMKAPKRDLQPAYIARLVVRIPLKKGDDDAWGNAVRAIAKIEASLPEGSVVTIISADPGKMEKKSA